MATRACIASPAYTPHYVPSGMSRLRRTSGGSLYGGNAGSVGRDYSTGRPPSGYGSTFKDRDTTSTYRSSTLGRTYGGSHIPPTGRTQYESKYGTPRYSTTGSTRAISPPSYTRKQSNVTSRAHTISPRPLPPGPGPLDENNRRMSINDSMRRLSRADTIPRTGPLRATHISSQGVTNGSLTRSHRTSSVTDLTAGLDNMNLSNTSSLARSRRFGSHADLAGNIPSTPEKKDDRVDQLFESTSRSPVTRSYYNTNANTYDYKEHEVLPQIRRRSVSQDPGGRITGETVSRDSPVTPASRRTSLVSSRAGSIDSPNQLSSRQSPDISDSCGLVGLKNLGNTCFMNSILQCLSNTRPLLEYCLNEDFKEDINRNTSNMKGALVNAYAKLTKSMWKTKGESATNPTDLKSQIQKHAPRFMGYNQQDAQEFLIYLLEGLHEDVNRVTVKKKNIISNDDGEEKISASEKARQTWKKYLERDNSKIVDIFVGQLKSALVCQTCGYTSNTFDVFWDLSLPIKKARSYGSEVSLTDCFDLFTSEEVLEGDEAPKCARCKDRRKCTKSFSVQKFPKVLIIHLKRFDQGSYIRSKLSTLVDYPLRDLDLTKYSAEKSGCPAHYSLYAVANHSGTPFSGHYTAYAKHPYSGEWHYYNDSRVSSAASSRVKSAEGYVLFYELSNQQSRL